MKRLLISTTLIASLFTTVTSSQAQEPPFDFEVLQFRAKALAAQPYTSHEKPTPDTLRNLTYDQYRDIRFDPARTWWLREKLPFQLQFFHPGFIYTKTVQVSEVDGRDVRPIERAGA